nr:TM2 domain-containing protein [uncultured Lacibacter sp.]
MRKIVFILLAAIIGFTANAGIISVPENASDVTKAMVTAPATTKTATAKKSSKSKLFMKILKNKLEKMAAKGKKAGDKSKVVAALLAFFLGNLGIHDFYLGNKKAGLLKIILTVAGIVLIAVGVATLATTATVTVPVLALIGWILLLGVSIWALIDFIRILTGSYQPVDGSYTD